MATVNEVDGRTWKGECTVDGVTSKKRERVEECVSSDTSSIGSSNSFKELICLEYIRGFQRQFEQLCPHRKPLFICPRNEHGIPKIVSTTIRPTLLPFREMYDYERLAQFTAGIVKYEPLEDALKPPHYLPSPAFTLDSAAGDCFDMSILLTSFLIGAGYDAFVVHGYAPKWICLHDQGSTLLPSHALQEVIHAQEDVADSKPVCTYKPTFIGEKDADSRSKYLTDQKSTREAQAKLKEEKKLAESFYNEREVEKDELDGKRVHAWVLLRAGKRGLEDHVFIEPSTGRTYGTKESPYIDIESVWNDENIWVNMQTQSMSTMLFDLANPTDWEFVFLSAGGHKPNDDGDPEAMDMNDLSDGNNEDEDNADSRELVLEVPPSWVPKLQVSKAVYKKRYVSNLQRVTYYECAKLEEYAESSHPQGLITRVSIYKDYGRTLLQEVREYFRNRKDKLEARRRYPFEGRFEEYFEPGRAPDALQSRKEWSGRKRELTFYTSARLDGLVKREELIQERVYEYFRDRDDFLVFRKVLLAGPDEESDVRNPYVFPGGAASEVSVKKMKEKFERNSAKEADYDTRARVYEVQEGSIRVMYHYAAGKITSSSRVFYKSDPGRTEVLLADPTMPQPKQKILDEELRLVLQKEKDCFAASRHSEMEVQDILKHRKREEIVVGLETSIFDAGDGEGKEDAEEGAGNQTKDDSASMDYLGPFLQHLNLHSNAELSKEDAITVRDMCLRNLKERLLERATIIQSRLDKENASLAKRQAAFQRSQREHEQGTDDEFERFCSDTMFRIQILEQRLSSHEETALQKYMEMDQRLHNDARLKVLNG